MPAAWLRDLVENISSDNQTIGTTGLHRSLARRTWVEKLRNKGGEFLKVSVCEKSHVKFVMIPAGGKKAGWKTLVAERSLWRGIIKCKEEFMKCVKIQVWKGNKMSFWKDKWFEG